VLRAAAGVNPTIAALPFPRIAGAPADWPRRRDDRRAVVPKRRILAELAAAHGIHGFPDQ
jgi:hypothetical protein